MFGRICFGHDCGLSACVLFCPLTHKNNRLFPLLSYTSRTAITRDLPVRLSYNNLFLRVCRLWNFTIHRVRLASVYLYCHPSVNVFSRSYEQRVGDVALTVSFLGVAWPGASRRAENNSRSSSKTFFRLYSIFLNFFLHPFYGCCSLWHRDVRHRRAKWTWRRWKLWQNRSLGCCENG